MIGWDAMKPENMIDPSTGILLTPSFHGKDCHGNGEHPGYECCCDECDYYLDCFPEWDYDSGLWELGTVSLRSG